ncbi:hypothetical protein [Hymenobacter weizhouensis]|uniref:hypothetical protein n=1 Tax=Hymenobacter sp. YIM 151500-1 TaxID=2987689 RepID=UPI0022265121|nr:hypothetical protein [Hymenobacter sp. YIM 151500-1]UYZ61430.1 hypothetical protein OIS53_10460 [Hymenobacter sp. YIM 151500-1]
MHKLLIAATLAASLLSGCSQAQSDEQALAKQEKKNQKKKAKAEALAAAGLRRIGTLDGVPESSGLVLTGQPGMLYTHGDEGNPPILYKINTPSGRKALEIRVPVESHDWESISRDPQGNLYIGDVGNNANDRQDLVVWRFNPEQPQQVGAIRLRYPDQTAFPPGKKERNFDTEASFWHNGLVYLFTKDRATQSTSKVYTVPATPGTHTAKLVTRLAIPGEVTDAALSPNGQRLVLLAREEMFVLQGASFPELLKATPERIALPGAGQTEGAVFLNDSTLNISTEQGALYEYVFGE